MFCKNCGTENFDEARFCKNCGQELVKEQQNTTAPKPETPVYSGPVEYDSVAHSVTDDSEIPQSTGTAIASMVLGIVSIVFCCSSIIGLVAGIIAIVLAQKERSLGRADNGYVKAGLVCGIIGAILSGLVFVYYIIVLIVGSTASVMSYRF